MGEDGRGGSGAAWRPSGPPRTGVEAPLPIQSIPRNYGRQCPKGDAPMLTDARLLRYASDVVDCMSEELPAPWEIDHAARRADVRALARSTVSDQVVPPPDEIACLIDHTLLRPDATEAEVEQLCADARAYRFASVCVLPRFVPFAALALRRSPVRVGTVVGFPLGASATVVKAVEAAVAVEQGARELDMVLAVGALKSGALGDVGLDIAMVVRVAHAGQALVKVILETALLSEDEQVRACFLARDAGADFVKTSTGYGLPGADERVVRRLRALVPPTMGVKAAGGIRTRADLERMLRAGATRIGTSSGVEIMQQYVSPVVTGRETYPWRLSQSQTG